MIGQQLGPYRLIEKIGAGGMGVVYRAKDERLDRDVAIKVLPPGALADEAARQRFHREALAMARLSQPNVGIVHEFDTQDGVDFLVIEFVPGTTLAEKLSAGALPEAEVAALGSQIAAALAEAHEHGVVHCDLKPGNVMVNPKGQVKVLDFGLARLVRREGPSADAETVTHTRGVAGTFPYMAPEQLRGGRPDARTDLYALGAVLYEMAAGRRPFIAQTTAELAAAILREPPPAPSAVQRGVSAGLERIILKCLEKDPERRYQSARELLADLGRLSAAPHPLPRRWLLAAALAVAALAIMIGVTLARRPASGRIEGLAVLPLKNLSGDPAQEYFADGMTEALITDLARIGALRVISQTSAMRYKQSKDPLPEIARALNVDAVVEGSVLRVGDRVRITAQLIEARTDRHLWAESYERDLRDILALQREVARTVAAEIRTRVTPQERGRLAGGRPVNPKAYEAYLRGRYHWLRLREEDFDTAVRYFRQSTEVDPAFAPAYSGLADCYVWLAYLYFRPPLQYLSEARAAALKALELDETLAEAHASLGSVALAYDWDWKTAEREFQRAIELSPSSAGAHFNYNFYLIALGRYEEGLAEARRTLELDPLTPWNQLRLGWSLMNAHRHQEAIPALHQALELDPNVPRAHMLLAINYALLGDFQQALAHCPKALAVPQDLAPRAYCGWAYARAGQPQQARKLLEQLQEASRYRHVDSYYIAFLYDGLRDRERTLEYLERAYQERSPSMPFLKKPLVFADLAGDPRFQDLLRRMKFP